MKRRQGRLLLAGCVAVAVGASGCGGDDRPPLSELPGSGEVSPATEIRIHVTLTFTREEEPVQVRRPVTVSLEEGDDPPGSAELLEIALGELVKGPTDEERAAGVFSFFSPETEGLVRDVRLTGDTAIVDFGDLGEAVPNASSSAGSFAFLSELNGTVFAIPTIRAVEYRMKGSCEAFWNFLQRACQRVARPEPA